MSVDYRKQLEDSKPRRERFPDQEQFEEALGYWMSHQGRILAMTRRMDGTLGGMGAYRKRAHDAGK
jgi:hypothetical protein